MNVKTDTKEKFTVITPQETLLPANMTAELKDLLLGYLSEQVPHIVLNMHNVQEADPAICEMIAHSQQEFYHQDVSFVISNLSPGIEILLKEKGLLETMNTTPSESEAWDILQMEEVERELLRGEWD
jgi:anti-anti-sigma regulatory factor